MGTSDITVTALTATPTIRGNKIAFVVNDTRAGAIPNVALDRVDIYASTTNIFSTASVVVSGLTDTLHAGLVEEQTYYYWGIPYNKSGSPGAQYPVSPTGGVACTTIGMSGLAFGLANGKLVASVAANALTIAVKTAAGNDPSAGDAVYVAFRNPTLATGNYQIRQITSALSLVISNGSTFSYVLNNAAFRLWLALFDDFDSNNVARLAAILVSKGGEIRSLPAIGIASTVAEGGSGGADSFATFYTSTTLTSRPFRVVGHLDWSGGLPTIGAWSAAPDATQLFGLGVRLPGEVVQSVLTPYTPYLSLSSPVPVPYDNTIPQDSEGGGVHAYAFSPNAAANVLEISYSIHAARTNAGRIISMVQESGSSNCFAASVAQITANVPAKLNGAVSQRAVNTTERTYTLRAGPDTADALHVNGNSGGALFAGALDTHLKIIEFQG